MTKRTELISQILAKVNTLLDRHVGAADGFSDLARFQAFHWDGRSGGFRPVARPVRIDQADLIGIDDIKNVVARNTQSFLDGRRANNVLLWGERGTGKSSVVKSLLTTFEGTNLRMVQVRKHDIMSIPAMYDPIAAAADQRFIVFIDDLSFEEGQTDYKEVKTILDGGLEAVPGNLLFYATSNRKHLVPTRFSDNESDDIRPSDTVEEKISLVERFGLRFGFYHFDQDTYLAIVASYARKYGVTADRAQLERLAIQWATNAGGRNGRVAEQFARMMAGVGT